MELSQCDLFRVIVSRNFSCRECSNLIFNTNITSNNIRHFLWEAPFAFVSTSPWVSLVWRWHVTKTFLRRHSSPATHHINAARVMRAATEPIGGDATEGASPFYRSWYVEPAKLDSPDLTISRHNILELILTPPSHPAKRIQASIITLSSDTPNPI